jgi:hypothetical protein
MSDTLKNNSCPYREPEDLSKGENIIKWIKRQRISWLGHLERMEEDRMPRKIFTQEMEGTRRRGRLGKGWREEVEKRSSSAGSEKMERVGDSFEVSHPRCVDHLSNQKNIFNIFFCLDSW